MGSKPCLLGVIHFFLELSVKRLDKNCLSVSYEISPPPNPNPQLLARSYQRKDQVCGGLTPYPMAQPNTNFLELVHFSKLISSSKIASKLHESVVEMLQVILIRNLGYHQQMINGRFPFPHHLFLLLWSPKWSLFSSSPRNLTQSLHNQNGEIGGRSLPKFPEALENTDQEPIFFSISKHQYISKGKRREAYREYTRRQMPHNKGPKKQQKTHQPSTGGFPLQETYKGPGLRKILPTPTNYRQKNT